jgi:hypothetical protein
MRGDIRRRSVQAGTQGRARCPVAGYASDPGMDASQALNDLAFEFVTTKAGSVFVCICAGPATNYGMPVQPSAGPCADQTAVQTDKKPYFGSAPSLTVNTVPDTGHDIVLHPSANVSFNMIDQRIHTH